MSIYWPVVCAECGMQIGWMMSGMLPYVICNGCKEKIEADDGSKGASEEKL